MTKKKRLLTLTSALVICLSVYGGLVIWNSHDDRNQNDATPLLPQDIDAITHISYTGSDGAAYTFLKSGESWILSGDETFPLNQTYPQALVAAVDDLYAIQTIEDFQTDGNGGETESLASYGLDSPSITVFIQWDDGSQRTLSLGDYNALAQGYYLMIDDDPSIYVVDSSLNSACSYGLLDLIQMEDIPFLSTATSLTVTRSDGTLQLTRSVAEENVDENGDSEDGSSNDDSSSDDSTEAAITYSWTGNFISDSNANAMAAHSDSGSDTDRDSVSLDTSLVDQLIENITYLNWQECAAYRPDDWSFYGLSKPSAVIRASNGEQGLTLLIGNACSDGMGYYATLENSQIIYTIDNATAEAFLQLQLADLMSS